MITEYLVEHIWVTKEERGSIKAMPRKSTIAPGQKLRHQLAKKYHLHEGTSTIERIWVDASLVLDEGNDSGKCRRMSKGFSVKDDHSTPTFTREEVANWFKK